MEITISTWQSALRFLPKHIVNMAASDSIWQPVSSDINVSFMYSESGISCESASMKSPIPIDQHCGFISFLSIAQKLQIDFLPVSWQPALQGIGLGGTAEIRQSLMNLQMTFAFKRARQPSGSGLHETHIFRCLIAEILVLGHPSIYGHPNILRLEGICWDVSPEDEKVLPVLVFEKSQYGDLGWFANSGSGIHMSFEHRLKLCADIVVAVQVMHSNCEFVRTLQRKIE